MLKLNNMFSHQCECEILKFGKYNIYNGVKVIVYKLCILTLSSYLVFTHSISLASEQADLVSYQKLFALDSTDSIEANEIKYNPKVGDVFYAINREQVPVCASADGVVCIGADHTELSNLNITGLKWLVCGYEKVPDGVITPAGILQDREFYGLGAPLEEVSWCRRAQNLEFNWDSAKGILPHDIYENQEILWSWSHSVNREGVSLIPNDIQCYSLDGVSCTTSKHILTYDDRLAAIPISCETSFGRSGHYVKEEIDEDHWCYLIKNYDWEKKRRHAEELFKRSEIAVSEADERVSQNILTKNKRIDEIYKRSVDWGSNLVKTLVALDFYEKFNLNNFYAICWDYYENVSPASKMCGVGQYKRTLLGTWLNGFIDNDILSTSNDARWPTSSGWMHTLDSLQDYIVHDISTLVGDFHGDYVRKISAGTVSTDITAPIVPVSSVLPPPDTSVPYTLTFNDAPDQQIALVEFRYRGRDLPWQAEFVYRDMEFPGVSTAGWENIFSVSDGRISTRGELNTWVSRLITSDDLRIHYDLVIKVDQSRNRLIWEGEIFDTSKRPVLNLPSGVSFELVMDEYLGKVTLDGVGTLSEAERSSLSGNVDGVGLEALGLRTPFTIGFPDTVSPNSIEKLVLTKFNYRGPGTSWEAIFNYKDIDFPGVPTTGWVDIYGGAAGYSFEKYQLHTWVGNWEHGNNFIIKVNQENNQVILEGITYDRMLARPTLVLSADVSYELNMENFLFKTTLSNLPYELNFSNKITLTGFEYFGEQQPWQATFTYEDIDFPGVPDTGLVDIYGGAAGYDFQHYQLHTWVGNWEHGNNFIIKVNQENNQVILEGITYNKLLAKPILVLSANASYELDMSSLLENTQGEYIPYSLDLVESIRPASFNYRGISVPWQAVFDYSNIDFPGVPATGWVDIYGGSAGYNFQHYQFHTWVGNWEHGSDFVIKVNRRKQQVILEGMSYDKWLARPILVLAADASFELDMSTLLPVSQIRRIIPHDFWSWIASLFRDGYIYAMDIIFPSDNFDFDVDNRLLPNKFDYNGFQRTWQMTFDYKKIDFPGVPTTGLVDIYGGSAGYASNIYQLDARVDNWAWSDDFIIKLDQSKQQIILEGLTYDKALSRPVLVLPGGASFALDMSKLMEQVTADNSPYRLDFSEQISLDKFNYVGENKLWEATFSYHNLDFPGVPTTGLVDIYGGSAGYASRIYQLDARVDNWGATSDYFIIQVDQSKQKIILRGRTADKLTSRPILVMSPDVSYELDIKSLLENQAPGKAPYSVEMSEKVSLVSFTNLYAFDAWQAEFNYRDIDFPGVPTTGLVPIHSGSADFSHSINEQLSVYLDNTAYVNDYVINIDQSQKKIWLRGRTSDSDKYKARPILVLDANTSYELYLNDLLAGDAPSTHLAPSNADFYPWSIKLNVHDFGTDLNYIQNTPSAFFPGFRNNYAFSHRLSSDDHKNRIYQHNYNLVICCDNVVSHIEISALTKQFAEQSHKLVLGDLQVTIDPKHFNYISHFNDNPHISNITEVITGLDINEGYAIDLPQIEENFKYANVRNQLLGYIINDRPSSPISDGHVGAVAYLKNFATYSLLNVIRALDEEALSDNDNPINPIALANLQRKFLLEIGIAKYEMRKKYTDHFFAGRDGGQRSTCLIFTSRFADCRSFITSYDLLEEISDEANEILTDYRQELADIDIEESMYARIDLLDQNIDELQTLDIEELSPDDVLLHEEILLRDEFKRLLSVYDTKDTTLDAKVRQANEEYAEALLRNYDWSDLTFEAIEEIINKIPLLGPLVADVLEYGKRFVTHPSGSTFLDFLFHTGGSIVSSIYDVVKGLATQDTKDLSGSSKFLFDAIQDLGDDSFNDFAADIATDFMTDFMPGIVEQARAAGLLLPLSKSVSGVRQINYDGIEDLSASMLDIEPSMLEQIIADEWVRNSVYERFNEIREYGYNYASKEQRDKFISMLEYAFGNDFHAVFQQSGLEGLTITPGLEDEARIKYRYYTKDSAASDLANYLFGVEFTSLRTPLLLLNEQDLSSSPARFVFTDLFSFIALSKDFLLDADGHLLNNTYPASFYYYEELGHSLNWARCFLSEVPHAEQQCNLDGDPGARFRDAMLLEYEHGESFVDYVRSLHSLSNYGHSKYDTLIFSSDNVAYMESYPDYDMINSRLSKGKLGIVALLGVTIPSSYGISDDFELEFSLSLPELQPKGNPTNLLSNNTFIANMSDENCLADPNSDPDAPTGICYVPTLYLGVGVRDRLKFSTADAVSGSTASSKTAKAVSSFIDFETILARKTTLLLPLQKYSVDGSYQLHNFSQAVFNLEIYIDIYLGLDLLKGVRSVALGKFGSAIPEGEGEESVWLPDENPGVPEEETSLIDNTGAETDNTGAETDNTGADTGITSAETGNTDAETGNTGAETDNTPAEGGNNNIEEMTEDMGTASTGASETSAIYGILAKLALGRAGSVSISPVSILYSVPWDHPSEVGIVLAADVAGGIMGCAGGIFISFIGDLVGVDTDPVALCEVASITASLVSGIIAAGLSEHTDIAISGQFNVALEAENSIGKQSTNGQTGTHSITPTTSSKITAYKDKFGSKLSGSKGIGRVVPYWTVGMYDVYVKRGATFENPNYVLEEILPSN